MKKSLSILVTLVSLSTSFALQAQARWEDRRHGAQEIQLGTVKIGDEGSKFDIDVLDIANNPAIECRLSHIRFQVRTDNIKLLKVEVIYTRNSSFGSHSDVINLGRAQGMVLDNFQSTQWLSLKDVADGIRNGRCVDKIKIYAVDIPDRNGRRHGGGFGGGFGGRFDRDNFKAAKLDVFGLLKTRHGRF